MSLIKVDFGTLERGGTGHKVIYRQSHTENASSISYTLYLDGESIQTGTITSTDGSGEVFNKTLTQQVGDFEIEINVNSAASGNNYYNYSIEINDTEMFSGTQTVSSSDLAGSYSNDILMMIVS